MAEKKTLSIREKLSKIQQEMKAPKNLKNTFGNYKYRNAEGILEAFKPYEEKYKVALLLDDTLMPIGDRYYIVAMATLLDCESEDSISVSSYAREQAEKRGMDAAQLTGATSSYARKYALNGLFLLDDTKDADSDEQQTERENRAKANEKKAKEQKEAEEFEKKAEQTGATLISAAKVNSIEKLLADNGIAIDFACHLYGVDSLSALTETKHSNMVQHIADIKKKQEENNKNE